MTENIDSNNNNSDTKNTSSSKGRWGKYPYADTLFSEVRSELDHINECSTANLIETVKKSLEILNSSNASPFERESASNEILNAVSSSQLMSEAIKNFNKGEEAHYNAISGMLNNARGDTVNDFAQEALNYFNESASRLEDASNQLKNSKWFEKALNGIKTTTKQFKEDAITTANFLKFIAKRTLDISVKYTKVAIKKLADADDYVQDKLDEWHEAFGRKYIATLEARDRFVENTKRKKQEFSNSVKDDFGKLTDGIKAVGDVALPEITKVFDEKIKPKLKEFHSEVTDKFEARQKIRKENKKLHESIKQEVLSKINPNFEAEDSNVHITIGKNHNIM